MSENKINKSVEVPSVPLSNKTDRRKLLMIIGIGGITASTLPGRWTKPVIDAVMLPAHAQTSMCVTDLSVTGPLVGHPSGAATCQVACEADATAAGAQLCSVTETVDAVGATQCGCDFDNP